MDDHFFASQCVIYTVFFQCRIASELFEIEPNIDVTGYNALVMQRKEQMIYEALAQLNCVRTYRTVS